MPPVRRLWTGLSSMQLKSPQMILGQSYALRISKHACTYVCKHRQKRRENEMRMEMEWEKEREKERQIYVERERERERLIRKRSCPD